MDERVKGAVAHAAMDAGNYLRSNGGRKSVYDIERRARGIMLSAFRKADPSLSEWSEGMERGISVCTLDATVNFSSGFGGYGTMAAYIESGEPRYGAIFLPLEGALVTAEAGKGARIEGRAISVSGRGALAGAIICCSCDSYLNDGEADVPLFMGLLHALSNAALPWRNIGSPALGYAYLAMGSVDAVVSPLRESSHAAGYLVMQEAGARLTDRRGRPFSLASHEVVAATPAIHDELLAVVGGALR